MATPYFRPGGLDLRSRDQRAYGGIPGYTVPQDQYKDILDQYNLGHYRFLQDDPRGFDFMKEGGPGVGGENLFQDLLNQAPTAAPTSVDEVRKGLETDLLKGTLGDIDLDTNQTLANIKLDAADQGIFGVGQNSDIVQNAMAQARSGADRTKAGARTSLALGELGRMTDRENRRNQFLKEIYGTRYGMGQQQGQEYRGALAGREQALMNLLLGYEGKAQDMSLARDKYRTETEQNAQRNQLQWLNSLLQNQEVGPEQMWTQFGFDTAGKARDTGLSWLERPA